MNRELKAVRDLLADWTRLDWDSNQRRLLIKERNNVGTHGLSEVFVNGITEDTIAFTLDKTNKKLSECLRASPDGPNKVCDAIIVLKQLENFYIVFCELKSGNTGGHEKQLMSADAFMDYVCSLLKHFYQTNLSANCVRKYVLFHQRRINIRPIRGGQAAPERLIGRLRVKQFNTNNVHINQLTA